MNFARRVFFWSGIYGILVLLPMYFLREPLERLFPPATNHPEQYYGFIGVALAWQFVFLLLASDVRRFRPLMLPAIAEKFLAAAAAIWLYFTQQIELAILGPFLIDLLLGFLFIISYFLSADRVSLQRKNLF
ncbi:hypothetical protein ACFL00_01495 [Pseudomonadota bacterium]